MGAHDMLVYDSVMGSNIPVEKKTLIRDWFDRFTGIAAPRDERRGITREHIVTGVQAIRQSLESNMVAGTLGVLHAEVGLDLGKVPLDAVSGTLLTGASVAMARSEISRDLLNMGTAAQNCFSFRKGYAWAAARKKRRGVAPVGDFHGESTMNGETDKKDPDADDPILKAAKAIRQKQA